MSEVFEGYEHQYCDLSANLSRKCGSASLLSDQDQKQQEVAEIKAGLDDAEALIRKMDLEARSLQAGVKATLLAKLREYNSDLNKLKTEFTRLTSPDADHAREDLLEAGMADAHLASADQSERLTKSIERIDESSDQIRESQKVMLETVGVSILDDLHQQRETLLNSHQKKQLMEEKTNRVVLLGIWPSGACARVALALKLKGILYKYVEEDLTNKSELLLKNNPIHKKVPVLLHNDKAIAESLVILEYIEETWSHTPNILPCDPYQRAKVRFWVNYFDQKIRPAINLVFISKAEERKKAIENLNEMIKDFYEGVKKDFGEEFPYCKGKCLGLLDIVVGTNAGNYKVINDALGMEVIHTHINSQFLSWMDALREHPLVKDTLPPHDKFVAKFRGKFGPIN